jgi:hypothetical protein
MVGGYWLVERLSSKVSCTLDCLRHIRMYAYTQGQDWFLSCGSTGNIVYLELLPGVECLEDGVQAFIRTRL